jgi:hypothetical protein
MSDRSNVSGSGSAEWLLGTVKNNPEGLLLLAAGCALLMRTGRRSQGPSRPYLDERYDGPSRPQDGGRVSQVGDAARAYASNVGDMVSETAGNYVAVTAEYADKARRVVADQSGRIADQTQSTIGHIVREQPLAVALAGLAAGAAIAAAFPATQMERETLGVAGQRASEAAAAAGQRVGEAASAARDRLKSAADERGLNTDGLKEVARDVASTIGKSVSRTAEGASGAEQKYQSSAATVAFPQTGGQGANAPVGSGSPPDKNMK